MRLIKRIFDLKIRLTLNRKLIIILSLIAIHGCTSVSNRAVENDEDIRIYPDLSQKNIVEEGAMSFLREICEVD